MKKSIAFILLLCSLFLALHSAVPYETALKVAQNFTLEKGGFSDVKSIQITHNQTFSDNGAPIFYIFNVNKKGFPNLGILRKKVSMKITTLQLIFLRYLLKF